MDLSSLAAPTRERLAQLCRDAGLDPSYSAFVARHVDADDASWRWCCGSQCDPCVEQLARVVEAARQLLRQPPPAAAQSGLPPTGPAT